MPTFLPAWVSCPATTIRICVFVISKENMEMGGAPGTPPAPPFHLPTYRPADLRAYLPTCMPGEPPAFASAWPSRHHSHMRFCNLRRKHERLARRLHLLPTGPPTSLRTDLPTSRPACLVGLLPSSQRGPAATIRICVFTISGDNLHPSVTDRCECFLRFGERLPSTHVIIMHPGD